MICKKSDAGSAERAAAVLSSGGVAILPTDTVYGFSGAVDLRGADPFQTDRKIREIKGRGEEKPFIHLIARPEDISFYIDCRLPPALLRHWPGALTVIVPVRGDSPLSGGLPTVAFRCPGDAWLRDVVSRTGRPVYSTSVNRSGQPVLQRVDDICAAFAHAVDLVVTDGDSGSALPSTVVRLEADGGFSVVRQGSVHV